MPIQNASVAAAASEITGKVIDAVKTHRTASGSPESADAPQTAAKQPPTLARLQRLAENMNKTMQQNNSSLEFSIDSSSEKVLVKLVDTSTGEIIRQIPSEEMLAISRSIEQMQRGLLLNKQA